MTMLNLSLESSDLRLEGGEYSIASGAVVSCFAN